MPMYAYSVKGGHKYYKKICQQNLIIVSPPMKHSNVHSPASKRLNRDKYCEINSFSLIHGSDTRVKQLGNSWSTESESGFAGVVWLLYGRSVHFQWRPSLELFNTYCAVVHYVLVYDIKQFSKRCISFSSCSDPSSPVKSHKSMRLTSNKKLTNQ